MMNIPEQYMADVLSGRQVACKWVRLAIERHRRDLATAAEYYFDPAAGMHVIEFFAFLKHSKGEWAGQTIQLEPWQQCYLYILFGWRRVADDLRRFRTGYLEVARKNGKSTLGAGIGLYLMVADGEPGAEVYSAATKRDQALIVHNEATRMVKGSPGLRKRVKVFRNNLHIEGTASKFEPLGADADTLDGLNIHAAIVDEIHAHKSRDVWDRLETATGARRQPLMLGITTAGYDRESLCWELHEYLQKILEQIVADDTFFGMIFSIDEGDDWADPDVWIKANPNLGVSKKVDDLVRKAKRAQEIPSSLNSFLRLELDIWTESESVWLSMEHWQACGGAVDADGLRGRTCYMGLDLSSNVDISAYALVFPPQQEDDPYQVLMRFFIPEEGMKNRSHNDRVPYDVWVRQGYITATGGNVIDYEYILSQIDEDAQKYDIAGVAFDRWGATQVSLRLADAGLAVAAFGQGFASMSAPTKALENLILGHELAHGHNPVLTWMAANAVTEEDAAGNIKVSKRRSREKIDGIVALVMGLDLALRSGGSSVYEERGIIWI
mgnify:FL=1